MATTFQLYGGGGPQRRPGSGSRPARIENALETLGDPGVHAILIDAKGSAESPVASE